MRLDVRADLGPLREAAKEKIDREAGLCRRRYITDAPGQEMVYLLKREQAQRWLEHLELHGGPPLLSEFPMIEAEVGITAVSGTGVAQTILSIASQWEAVAGAIERLRVGGKRAVEDALTVAEIEAATRIDWPAP